MRRSIARRDFFARAAAVTTGFASLRFLVDDVHGIDRFFEADGLRIRGYGNLVPDPDGVLDLPEGFTYQILSVPGEEMSDGLINPGLPDGMAAFPGPDGSTVLLRNHEIDGKQEAIGPFGEDGGLRNRLNPSLIYDNGFGKNACKGGVSRLCYDTRTRRVTGSEMGLAGTLRNCAGGPTPWGTWVTCEETVQLADREHEKDHGYAFEVSSEFGCRLDEPVPLREMGRFNHEAIAVDGQTGIVYLTEDRHDSLIYRYIPNLPGKLAKGGILQALAVRYASGLDTRNWAQAHRVPVGEVLEARWIDLEDIQSPRDDLRFQGFDKGAARFARGEGMWYGNDAIYFACTNGGHAKKGQIWRYVPSRFEGKRDEQRFPGRLELFSEPNNADLLEMADNLTVAPWGDLILCEDGPGDQNLVGLTPRGDIYRFGHNALSKSEFAGVTFSPDGSTLFCNIQKDGLTLAIRGPWRSGDFEQDESDVV